VTWVIKRVISRILLITVKVISLIRMIEDILIIKSNTMNMITIMITAMITIVIIFLLSTLLLADTTTNNNPITNKSNSQCINL